MVKKKL